jgi:hypothetical protein
MNDTLFPLPHNLTQDVLYSRFWKAVGSIGPSGPIIVLYALVAEEDFDPAVGHTCFGTFHPSNGREANRFLAELSGRELTHQTITAAREVAHETEMKAKADPVGFNRYLFR